MRLAYAQVDAFADGPFSGNPAAVVRLETWLEDTTMQAIAAEIGLAETAFLLPDASGAADHELRWFSPTMEVAMCGHATLASGHVLLSADPAREAVTFRTRKAGLLKVGRDGEGYTLDLPARVPDLMPLPAIVAMLGVSSPVATLWHPHRYAVVILAGEAAVRAVRPDFRSLAREGDLLTIVTAPGTGTDIVSRAFAPGAGVDEDPATGSAHAVIAPYWAKMLGRDHFTAFQASARGGHMTCRVAGNRVILTGLCTTVIEGSLLL